MNTAHRPTALITGASAGLGAEFARQLAQKGYDLALTARRVERLEALAGELSQRYGIEAQFKPADLSSEAGLHTIEAWIPDINDLEILVNNAGYGIRSRFANGPLQKQLDMIHVHVLAAVRLTRAALPEMLRRQRGAIVNVASMASFFPIRNTMYTSSKAFLVNFSKSLQSELNGSPIKVQALIPGFVHTEFHDSQEYRGFRKESIPSLLWLEAPDVVARSLRDLERGKLESIPGWQYRIIAFLARCPLTNGATQGVARFLYTRRRS